MTYDEYQKAKDAVRLRILRYASALSSIESLIDLADCINISATSLQIERREICRSILADLDEYEAICLKADELRRQGA